ncbi:MAG: hypothetical protein AB7T31_11720 [Gemmatimonadales bacterium]
MTEALQLEIRTLRALLDSERDPGGRAFAPLADAYRRAGKVPEALKILREGIGKHPDFVTGHVVAAQLYVEQGLSAEGAIAARRALELDAENVCALKSLLRVLDESGEGDEAEEVRALLTTLDPDFTPDWSLAGPPEEPWEAAAAAPEATETLDAGVATPEAVSPDASTLELRALRPETPEPGIEQPAAQAPETEEAPAAFGEGMIDLTTLGPLPSAELPLSALAPDLPAAPPSEPEAPWSPDAMLDLGLTGPIAEEAEERQAPPIDFTGVMPAAGMPVLDPTFEPVIDEAVMDIGALAPEPMAEEEMAAGATGPDETVMDLAMLAPDAADEPVMELEALAPDSPADETVMDLAMLAPDAADEPVMDLAMLAPDASDEPVMDIGALAPESAAEEMAADAAGPDETVMDLAMLAPDAADEPVMEMEALAPESPADETVMDLAMLAPDPADEPVMEMEALAPEAAPDTMLDPVLDAAALSPDDHEEPIFDLAMLAPTPASAPAPARRDEPPGDAPEAPGALVPDEEPVFDLEALAPAATVPTDASSSSAALSPTEGGNGRLADEDAIEAGLFSAEPSAHEAAPETASSQEPSRESVEPPADEVVIDLDVLHAEPTTASAGPSPARAMEVEVTSAPAEEETPQTIPEIDEESPSADSLQHADGDSDSPDEQDEPIYTRTLAELYAAQGATKEALTILRRLLAESPDDQSLSRRVAEVEAGVNVARDARAEEREERGGTMGEDVEALARELAESGGGSHDVDSPFAWTDREPTPETAPGPTIGEYFDGLLSWEPPERP